MKFDFVVFGDLHVNANTLSKAVEVLQIVGQVAKEKQCPVVCTGDFWDARGVLATRQVDAILSEIEKWRKDGVQAIFIPGNHDQVTMSGTVHGLRIFDAFSNVVVATDPILDSRSRVAFLPWREDLQDQQQLFNLPGEGDWTVFAHAEVQKAVANNGSEARGKVTLGQINSVARACYLGHYHKRQKIGDRTWYLGNPFELHMGEREQPKGVAYVTSEKVDPEFLDLHRFPKHFRVDLRAPSSMPVLRKSDVLELVGSKAQLRDPSIMGWVESLPTQDVRQISVPDNNPDSPPPMENDLHNAISSYVDIRHNGDDKLVRLGKSLVDQATKGVEHFEPAGTKARILRVEGTDFCGLRGAFSMDLANQGVTLLKGEQGVGKTALVDSISWALFGATAPRKPGGEASFRGDEVVHDGAKATKVVVSLEVDGSPYQVTRKKERGKGSRVRVKGSTKRPEGISDDPSWVESLVGVPYPIWKSCVSIGQGAVTNFLTATDKQRKELLSGAFGLGVCEKARKMAKKELSKVEASLASLQRELAAIEGAIQHMEKQDFTKEVNDWFKSREIKRQQLENRLDQVDDVIIEAKRALKSTASVGADLGEINKKIEAAEKELTLSSSPVARRDDLQKLIGACEAEKSVLERDLASLHNELDRLIENAQGRASGTCPTCGQDWDRSGVDQHAGEIERKIKGKAFEIQNLLARISNAEMSLAGIQGVESGEREKHLATIQDLRSKRAKLLQAKEAVGRIEANLASAKVERDEIQAQKEELEEAENPWEGRSNRHEEDLSIKVGERDYLKEDIEDAHREREKLLAWVEGFGQNGLPVMILRAVIGDLETTANEFLGQLTQGKLWAELTLADSSLDVSFSKHENGHWHKRRYEQLSGGERRCAELAFAPLGLSEMMFRRLKCKVPFLVIDELTTHLGAKEKEIACRILAGLDRETVLVIDHDLLVQSQFHTVYNVSTGAAGLQIARE